MAQDKRILITGGAGFIGSAVARKLADLGLEVIVLDNLSPQIHGDKPFDSYTVRLAQQSGTLVIGDVCSSADMRNAMRGITHVLLLAAETGTGQSMYQASKYSDVNISGTNTFLDILQEGGHTIEKVLVASSRAVYGEGKAKCPSHGAVYPHGRTSEDMNNGDFATKCTICNQPTEPLATDEDSALRPSSVYAITKLTQEQLVLLRCGLLGVSATALRYQNVYGPGQSMSNPYTGIVSIFSRAMMEGRKINVFEDGLPIRDFVYIDDVVNATVAALSAETADGKVINVGSGSPKTILDLVDTLEKTNKYTADYYISGEYRIGDIRNNYADTSRMTELLELTPTWSLTEGIKIFWNWAERILEADTQIMHTYEGSIDELRQYGVLMSKGKNQP